MAQRLLVKCAEVTIVSNRVIKALVLLSLACSITAVPPRVAGAAQDAGSPAADQVTPAPEEPRGKVLTLERVAISGNAHVSDSAILGTLDLAARDTITAELLEKARLRLLDQQPLLSTVDIASRPGSRRGRIILDIAVTEKKPIVFETGYGHHDTYGWFLTLLGLRVDPAAAYGTEYRLGLRLGFHIAGLDGGFERRAEHGRLGWGGSFHLYTQEQIFYADQELPAAGDSVSGSQDAREYRQKIGRAGAELFLRYRLSDNTRFTFGLQAETVRPDSSYEQSEDGAEFEFSDFPRSLQPDIKHSDIVGLFLRAVRDTRDRADYPRSGSYLALRGQWNSDLLGGDESYAKAEYDVRTHIGFGSWRVLSSRLSGGIVSNGTPYYDRFYLGGAYSIRGFRGLSLSPPSGHDGYVIASSEIRFPLIASSANLPPRLSGLMFVDAGFGWKRGDAFRWTDVQASAGYGVRMRLPWIGTLGIDMGVPFTDGRTDDRFYVHGCVGFSF